MAIGSGVQAILEANAKQVNADKPSKSGLPKHLAAIRLPSGKTVGTLSVGEVASMCVLFGVTDAHHNGKQKNIELLSELLESVGRKAAEKAIADFMAATMDGSAVGGGPVGGAP